MKRLNKIKKSDDDKTKELIEAAKHFDLIGEKQIIGHSRIAPAGKQAINNYFFSDNTDVIEDDYGNAIMPTVEDFKSIKKAKVVVKNV